MGLAQNRDQDAAQELALSKIRPAISISMHIPKPMTNMQFLLLRLARSLEGRLGCVPVHLVSIDLVKRARKELREQGIVWNMTAEDLRSSSPNETKANQHG